MGRQLTSIPVVVYQVYIGTSEDGGYIRISRYTARRTTTGNIRFDHKPPLTPQPIPEKKLAKVKASPAFGFIDVRVWCYEYQLQNSILAGIRQVEKEIEELQRDLDAMRSISKMNFVLPTDAINALESVSGNSVVVRQNTDTFKWSISSSDMNNGIHSIFNGKDNT